MASEDEFIYYVKALDNVRCSIVKEVNGHVSEENVYVIEGVQCNCPHAVYRKRHCKHLDMKKTWEAMGRKPMTFKPKGKGFDIELIVAQE